jgi:eukaryotic-like serine/threonine-protein kinase
VRNLSDETLDRLREVVDWPDLGATKYVAEELIASGGMGSVFRVRDTELDRDVAMKVIRLPEGGDGLAARLRQEARILARLEHPGIVPVHDSGELPDGRGYYVMKLVRGRRLDEHARERPELVERLRVFERVCEPVSFAHAHGVVHRDLKPENVMIGAYGEVLVLDWGVAKVLAERAAEMAGPFSTPDGAVRTGHGAVLGTPGYMAPEQARGEAATVDHRADVYALGAILYFLLADEPPPEEGERIARELTARRGVPAGLRAVCLKALARDPADRYQSVDELGREVSRFLGGLSIDAYREPLAARVARFARRHRVALLLLLAYLLLRVVLLFVARV